MQACYAFANVPPDDIAGKVPKRNIVVTAEDVAITEVLAGCSPEQFPVMLAGVRAVCDEAFNVHSASASTSGAAICLIASGPLAAVAGLSARRSLLGGGNRANMCVGGLCASWFATYSVRATAAWTLAAWPIRPS